MKWCTLCGLHLFIDLCCCSAISMHRPTIQPYFWPIWPAIWLIKNDARSTLFPIKISWPAMTNLIKLLKWCLERWMNNKLKFKLQWHWEAGRGAVGVCRKGGGYLLVSGRVWTIPEQSGWYGGGRGREECRCNNKGRQWTGQSAQSKWQAADMATEQAVTFCLYSPPSILALSTPSVCCYTQIIKLSSMLYMYAFMWCNLSRRNFIQLFNYRN